MNAPRELTFGPGDIVHELVLGAARCGSVQGPPIVWPVGHTWVRTSVFRSVPLAHRCPKCASAPKAAR